jgi:hypothetical protein
VATSDRKRNDKIELAPPPRADRKPPKRPDKKPERRAVPARVEPARVDSERSDRADAADKAETSQRSEKRTAARSTLEVKNEAAALYRTKNFGGASALVTQSLPAFSGEDAKDLKNLAAIYSQLGKSYSVGMAPGTKATDAYISLRRAITYDQDVGKAYVPEMEARLAIVAERAAPLFMASKEYEAAMAAVRQSEALGGNTTPGSTNKSVRDKLTSIASELLTTATSELSSNPDEAKRKAHQVQSIVDSKNPLYAKAARLINAQ